MARLRRVPRSVHRGAPVDPPSSRTIDTLRSAIGARSVALVHEWVDQRAGSELTFERVAQLLPEADAITLSWSPKAILDLPQEKVEVSVLDIPPLRDRRAVTLPVMPHVWRTLGRRHDPDIVVSSSHAFSRCFAETAGPDIHLSYVHSPARYLWFPDVDERARRAPRQLIEHLQAVDRRSARSACLAANSSTTAERVKLVYDRPSVVIPPPVNVSFFGEGGGAQPKDRPYLLSVGRWIPYKRHDLVIEVALELGLPVVIAGGGPLEPYLQEQARRSDLVQLCHRPSGAELRALYRDAAALVYPAHEDFGIVPVEAQAAGTPVVALGAGGTKDTVLDGTTGFHVEHQDHDAFTDGVLRVLEADIDPTLCRENAHRYSYEAFDHRIRDWMVSAVG